MIMDVKTDLKNLWVCPNCGSDMNLSNNESNSVYVCPECGCTIDAEEQKFNFENACPNCNQIMDGNECSYCGYDLGSDFD
jgi:DNA-directed RNA polymerase subunit RPC12/RpoP